MITNRDPKLGTSSYDIERKVIDLEAFTGSKTKAPMDIYVDGDSGDDANSGTQSEPLATITEAESRIPDIVNDLVKVWVQPATAAYTMPDVRPRIYRANLWFVGGAGNDDFHFTELLGSTEAQAGSDAKQVVTSGGLGVNTHQGKTIEILTGARAGDLRMIREHDDTTIEVAYGFGEGDAVSAGDTFRIVEPSVEVDPPEKWRVSALPLGQRQNSGVSNTTAAVLGPGFFNLKVHPAVVIEPDCEAKFFGCDFIRIQWSAGVLFFGKDRPTTLGNTLVTEGDFDAADHNFRGWGGHDGPIHISIGSVLYAAGLMSPRSIVRRGRYFMEGGATYSGGLKIQDNTMMVVSAEKPSPGDIRYLLGRSGSGEDAALVVEEDSLVPDSELEIASDVAGIIARRGGRVFTDAIGSVSSEGMRAETGGRIHFPFGVSLSGTPDTRVVDAGANTDQDIADYTSDGDYIAAGDGSVIQRV